MEGRFFNLILGSILCCTGMELKANTPSIALTFSSSFVSLIAARSSSPLINVNPLLIGSLSVTTTLFLRLWLWLWLPKLLIFELTVNQGTKRFLYTPPDKCVLRSFTRYHFMG